MTSLFSIATKITRFSVLSSKYWFYDFDVTRFQKSSMSQIFTEILDNFVFLIPVEILSNYPNFDSSLWLRKDVQWIIDKDFGQKVIV